MTSARKAQELAEAVGREMFRKDCAVQFLGITLDEIGPGYARMSLRVAASMGNSHGMCHGGMIFALADSAFAYACNSHNHNAVASGCAIEFLAPAQVGDLLAAEARERTLAGRNGIYDVDVRDQHGKLIATFRGKSHRIAGESVNIQGG